MGIRSRSIYDSKGKAYEIVDGEVTWVRSDLAGQSPNAGSSETGAPAILGDVPAFVSPIDGTIVSGRAALREHCKRHDVVPTAELKGLPPKPMVNNEFSKEYREGTRRTIAEVINSRGYFSNR